MENINLNRMNRDRNIVNILTNIFDQDDNDSNGIFGCNIRHSDAQNNFINTINDNCDDVIRVWLSMGQDCNDSDTWRGINRVFGLLRSDVTMLRRLGIVANHNFDDGTLHLNLNRDAVVCAILDAITDDVVQDMVDSQQSIIDNAQRIIDSINNN